MYETKWNKNFESDKKINVVKNGTEWHKFEIIDESKLSSEIDMEKLVRSGWTYSTISATLASICVN